MPFQIYIQEKHAAINLLDRVVERMLNEFPPYTEDWDNSGEAADIVLSLSRAISRMVTPLDSIQIDGSFLIEMVRNLAHADTNPYVPDSCVDISGIAAYLTNTCNATREEIAVELGQPIPNDWKYLTPEWHELNGIEDIPCDCEHCREVQS